MPHTPVEKAKRPCVTPIPGLHFEINKAIIDRFAEFRKRTGIPFARLGRHLLLCCDWTKEDSKHVIFSLQKEVFHDPEELRKELRLAVDAMCDELAIPHQDSNQCIPEPE